MMQITKDPKILANVWSVKPATNGKYVDIRITTSERSQSGEYLNSTWFPRLLGNAIQNLKDIKPGDWIIITKAKISNISYKDKNGANRNLFNFVIFEAEKAEGRIFGGGHYHRDKSKSTAPIEEPDPMEAKYEDSDDDDQPW